jgi:hypothetical protein
MYFAEVRTRGALGAFSIKPYVAESLDAAFRMAQAEGLETRAIGTREQYEANGQTLFGQPVSADLTISGLTGPPGATSS